ncbi:hypothetical protein PPTG_20786 [Phytophthora nicotianae INRA-310]|uniref:Uncharacterized protein n=1 Tax=Phytophthora nicotianae (strain INRA-310) TaxID=761204 RepID=W2RG56_PHYN3|nr:hypothetical protein PPTG_20786 [Phytophthora nicotianae INRA-310]ETN24362.1 hypothetical protein PPTG_20786 [Phytophthora nicotianae INRA-310]
MGNIFNEVPTQVYYVSICSCADVSSIPSVSLGTPDANKTWDAKL